MTPPTAPRRWHRLQSHPYDLVLLDLGLPGMSGLDVLAQLPGGPAVAEGRRDDR